MPIHLFFQVSLILIHLLIDMTSEDISFSTHHVQCICLTFGQNNKFHIGQ